MNTNGQILNNPGKYAVIKGPTVLYKGTTRSSVNEGVPLYTPFQIDDAKMLITIRDALIGDKRARAAAAYTKAHVRFGWIEPGFNSLVWIKLSDLVDGHYNNTLNVQQKRKLMEVCKLVFVSIKDIPRTASQREIEAANKIKAKHAKS